MIYFIFLIILIILVELYFFIKNKKYSNKKRKKHYITYKKKENISNKIVDHTNSKNENKNNSNRNIVRQSGIKKISLREELKRKLDGNFSKNDKDYIYEKFNNRCFKCGNKNDLTIDHHIPLKCGIGLKIDKKKYNAVLLCRRCNNKKNNKMPEEFYNKIELELLKNKFNVDSVNLKNTINLNSTINYKIKEINNKIEKNAKLEFIYQDVENNYKIEHINEFFPKKIIIEKLFKTYGFERKYILEGENKGEKEIKRYNIKYIISIKE